MIIGPISNELAIVYNLCETAKFHKANCNIPHCNVSLHMLKRAAFYIQENIVDIIEYKDAIDEIEKVDWR